MISARSLPAVVPSSSPFAAVFKDLRRFMAQQPPTPFDVAAALDGRRFLRREFSPELPLRLEHLTFPAYEPPLQRWWLHWHDYYEIIVPLEGAGRFQVGDVEVPFRPGHIMVVESLRLHGGAEVTQTHRSLVIFFPADWIAPPGSPLGDRAFLSALGTRADGVLPVLHPESSDAAGAMQCVRQLAEAYYHFSSPEERYLECKVALLALLAQLRRHFGDSAGSNEAQQRERIRQQERLQKVLPYLAQHFTEPLTQPEVAKVAGMSASRFRAFFKQTTGTTLAGYLRQLRLGRAAEMLRSSDRALSDIAAETGFADQSHLFRCFRTQFGCGPFEYRRREQSGVCDALKERNDKAQGRPTQEVYPGSRR